MTSLLPYLLYLALIGMHQVMTINLISVYGATVNLAALIVVLVAVYSSETTAAWFGFWAGIVAFAGVPAVLGWHGLVLALIGIASFHIRGRLNLDSQRSRLLLVTGGVLAHNLISFIIDSHELLWWAMTLNILVGALYTGLLAWIFFLFKDRRISTQKVRSVF